MSEAPATGSLYRWLYHFTSKNRLKSNVYEWLSSDSQADVDCGQGHQKSMTRISR